ncbi:MAG TPA: zf-HC2 domain-containing protein [Nocardioides sp.]|uniref:anti-sigma factor family protein n=1 Tax=Nocardioides sp. TaxID=35761 RepID=UPI002E336AFB|nr:zf-HC2 domain-containing protein [Nocardioides sp.]HEX5088356.1 zf-HC2 domain-containing protein [Nocardioides sp.]
MKIRRSWGRRGGGHEMTCQQAVNHITAYLDGALAGRDRDKLERHLEECPHCWEHLKQIEATIRVAGAGPGDDLDPLAREDLLEIYRRWRADQRPVD